MKMAAYSRNTENTEETQSTQRLFSVFSVPSLGSLCYAVLPYFHSSVEGATACDALARNRVVIQRDAGQCVARHDSRWRYRQAVDR